MTKLMTPEQARKTVEENKKEKMLEEVEDLLMSINARLKVSTTNVIYLDITDYSREAVNAAIVDLEKIGYTVLVNSDENEDGFFDYELEISYYE